MQGKDGRMPMKETMVLAEFVAGLSYDKLPQEVKEMSMRLFYDFMGNSSYATKTEAGRIITEYSLFQGSPGNCMIFPDFC